MNVKGMYPVLDNFVSYAVWLGKPDFPLVKARISMIWNVSADKSAPPTNHLNLEYDAVRKSNERWYLRTFPLTYRSLPIRTAYLVVQFPQTPDL